MKHIHTETDSLAAGKCYDNVHDCGVDKKKLNGGGGGGWKKEVQAGHRSW